MNDITFDNNYNSNIGKAFRKLNEKIAEYFSESSDELFGMMVTPISNYITAYYWEDMTAKQVRRITGQAGSPKLENRFHEFVGKVQFRQAIQTVQQKGLKLRIWDILLRNQLGNLRKVGGSRQLQKVFSQALEKLKGNCFIDGILSPIFKERKFSIGQELTGRGKGTVFAP